MIIILKIRKLLKNMSSKFKHVNTIIEESKYLSKLFISELLSSFKVRMNKR